MLSTWPEMVRFGMASKVKATVWLAARRAESVSANGITATKLLLSSITMKPDDPPVPPVDGAGARDPGDCAVPPPAVSPGTPLMLITTPDVGRLALSGSGRPGPPGPAPAPKRP